MLCSLVPALLLRLNGLAKIPRIGFLGAGSSSSYSTGTETLRQGLRDLGYVEGKNISFEFRFAEGKLDGLPSLAAELIGLGVNVIVTTGMPAVIAAKKATSTIPIVTANADNSSRSRGCRQSRPPGRQRHRIDESRCGL